MRIEIPRLYAITDRERSGKTHEEQVKRLAAGGVRLIQLRDKGASPRDFYRSAQRAVQMARELDVVILINDRVDIALAVDAHGVHLGQKDLPPEKARRLLGEDKIIGFSTHSIGQITAARDLPIDYVAFGPVFATGTKPDHDPPVGLEVFAQARNFASVPVVGIGGITLETADNVIRAGADSVAVISELVSAEDMTARVGEFLRVLGIPKTIRRR